MKKIYVIAIVSILVMGLSYSTVGAIKQNYMPQQIFSRLDPDTIEGVFTGQFALKNETGYVILGTVEGFYNMTNYTGGFEGTWTSNDDGSTGDFQGWFWGSFFMGTVDGINGTDWFVGLSMVNETDFTFSAVILVINSDYDDYYIRYAAGDYQEIS